VARHERFDATLQVGLDFEVRQQEVGQPG
jgi:hypothetical protein